MTATPTPIIIIPPVIRVTVIPIGTTAPLISSTPTVTIIPTVIIIQNTPPPTILISSSIIIYANTSLNLKDWIYSLSSNDKNYHTISWSRSEISGYLFATIDTTSKIIQLTQTLSNASEIHQYPISAGNWTITNGIPTQGKPLTDDAITTIYYHSSDDTIMYASIDHGEWKSYSMFSDIDPSYQKIEMHGNDTMEVSFISNGEQDNRFNHNYVLSLKTSNVFLIDHGTQLTSTPNELNQLQKTTIYYRSNINTFIHYQVGTSDWTTLPGTMMDQAEFDGYQKITITNEHKTISASFSSNGKSWDNNLATNYHIPPGTWTLSNGKLWPISPDQLDSITIYYYSDHLFDYHNFVFQINNGEWSYNQQFSMIKEKNIPYDSYEVMVPHGGHINFAITDGFEFWDNNEGNNYEAKKGIWILRSGKLISDNQRILLNNHPTKLVGYQWDYDKKEASFRWNAPVITDQLDHYELYCDYQSNHSLIGSTKESHIDLTFDQIEHGFTFDTTLDLRLRVMAVYQDGTTSSWSNYAYYVEEAAFDWKRVPYQLHQVIKIFVDDTVKKDQKSYDGLMQSVEILKPYFSFQFVSNRIDADWYIRSIEHGDTFNILGLGVPTSTSRHKQLVINADYPNGGYVEEEDLFFRSHLHEMLHAIGLNHQPNIINTEEINWRTNMSYTPYNEMCELDSFNLQWLLKERSRKPLVQFDSTASNHIISITNQSKDDTLLPYFTDIITKTVIQIKDQKNKLITEKSIVGDCGTMLCQENVILSSYIPKKEELIPIRFNEVISLRVHFEYVGPMISTDKFVIQNQGVNVQEFNSNTTSGTWSDWILNPKELKLVSQTNTDIPTSIRIDQVEYQFKTSMFTLPSGTYTITIIVTNSFNESSELTTPLLVN